MEESLDELAMQEFLSDISCLDELEDALGKPNIFDVLGMARAEIRHSNMLAWILDPRGSHGMGSLFLRTFLQKLGRVGADALKLLTADLESFEVIREYKHIDLLLVSHDPSSRVVVAIENKVDSGEHDNQLARYMQTVHEDFANYHHEFVFLTPEGDESSEESWHAIGYREILDGLEYCRKRINLSAEPDLLLREYAALLEREFMDQNKLSEICNRIYRNHKRALDLIFELKEDRCGLVFAMIDKWFVVHADNWMIYDRQHSNKSYVRFTTQTLLQIAPPLKDGKKSGWNSDKSAYYEIVIRKDAIWVKLSASSFNIDPTVLERLRTTFKLNEHAFAPDWQWKRLYRLQTKYRSKADAEESLDQDQIDSLMQKLCKEIHVVEEKIRQTGTV